MKEIHQSELISSKQGIKIPRCDSDVGKLYAWAKKGVFKDNINREYILGVLATLNYLTWRDEKTPGERIGDFEGIIDSLYTPAWIKYYAENGDHPEQS